MTGAIDPSLDYVERLSQQLGREWRAISAASESANEVLAALYASLGESRSGGIASDDLDVVAFGSLVRREWTSGSDVDWTLLVDGQASPDHRKVAQDLAAKIAATVVRGKTLPRPGAEGIFGNLVFSHDIIHHIGGQADTNRNTTQRILLLLEAVPIRRVGLEATLGPFERVTRAILYRYLHDDTNFAFGGLTGSRIPRFLLNDIVRYWRTLCVDFAYKEWEQAGGKWAIRNVKLRMSRKLLFVSGLLTVFSCHQNDTLQIDGGKPEQYLPMMQAHLTNFVRSTPLNIVVWSLEQLGLLGAAGDLLDHYNRFLTFLDDDDVRNHLGALSPQSIYQDRVFLELRDISHQFQQALDAAFFDAPTQLRQFTIQYGVF